MELFNQKTLPLNSRKSDARPYISVGRNGRITVLSAAIKLMELSEGDLLGFSIIDDQLYVIPQLENAYPLRHQKKFRKENVLNLVFQHVFLAEKIIQMIPPKLNHEFAKAVTFKMLVSKEPVTVSSDSLDGYKCYPVITSSATFTLRKPAKP